jgi:hypothetical protein
MSLLLKMQSFNYSKGRKVPFKVRNYENLILPMLDSCEPIETPSKASWTPNILKQNCVLLGFVC